MIQNRADIVRLAQAAVASFGRHIVTVEAARRELRGASSDGVILAECRRIEGSDPNG